MSHQIEVSVEDEEAMAKWQLANVLESNGRLKERFTVNSQYFACQAVVGHWGIFFLTLVIVPIVWKYSVPPMLVFCMLFLGLSSYRLTILMHDCSHNTLFTTSKMNNLIGIATGWMIGSNFYEFRKTHWLHHLNYGKKNDPQGRDYLGLRNASRLQIIWHLIRPLLGYNLFKLGGFIPSPIKREQSSRIHKQTKNYFIGVITTQGLIATIISGFGMNPVLALLYPASAATVGLFFSQIRGFCEHVPSPHHSNEENVRTHVPNWFDRIFFYSLNFNYHVEHHLFPSVPSYSLPALHSEIKLNCHDPESISESIFSTIQNRLNQCKE